MELKEPKKKKRSKLEPKSPLPLVFGSKGELTKFHANLTALGSCIADPTEMEIIYKMGYFGKGSLSKSHPLFGRLQYHAPPIIRNRQWQRRQEWISEVQKLSIDTIFEDDKNEGDQQKIDEKKSEPDRFEITDDKHNEMNESMETPISACESNISTNTETSGILEKPISDIEIVGNLENVKTNGQSDKMEVDEVVLDSTEEEDISEASAENSSNNFDHNSFFFDGEEELQIDNEYRNNSDLQGKVLVLPDSDSDTEDYLVKIEPKVKHENFPVRETLHLSFEETFFLMYGLDCLRVIDFDGKYLSIGETWDYFCKEHKTFIQKYVTYHYFRSKGWVVKPGLKYGGDYLLYKEGPSFYHSSYIVIIDVLDSVTFKKIESKSVRNMTWNKCIGLERLADSVSKEVLFAQVLWPSSVPLDTIPTSPDVLSQFTVKELLWRRWKMSQSNSNVDDRDDDEDGYSS